MSPLARPSVPDPRAPGPAAGITEPMIEQLVSEFYRRVRQHRLLGPIFDAAVEDWDQQLSRMRDFWSSVVLMSGRYKGKPVLVHAMLPGITPAHFRQWLALFDVTASDVCQRCGTLHRSCPADRGFTAAWHDHSRCRRWRPACIFACIEAGTDNTEFRRRT